MRNFLLSALLTCFLLPAFAQQAQVVDSPRELICDMSGVTQKMVGDFKEFCTRLDKMYPLPSDREKHRFEKKLFLNRMHGIIKRGMTFDKLTVAQRSEAAESSINYVIEFLKYETGDKITMPDGFQQSGDPCKLKDLSYDEEARCYEDANYMVLKSVTNQTETKLNRFWDVLLFIARKLECERMAAGG